MSNKQTSIEWLFNKLWEISKDKFTWHSVLEQAKEMHKQEIMDAYLQCGKDNFDHIKVINRSAEEYYQETFVSNKKIKFNEEEWNKLNNESKGSDEVELPQQEISDEEIYEGIIKHCSIPHDRLCAEINAMIGGAKWYREQLKIGASKEK
jgi:hypothetical protein